MKKTLLILAAGSMLAFGSFSCKGPKPEPKPQPENNGGGGTTPDEKKGTIVDLAYLPAEMEDYQSKEDEIVTAMTEELGSERQTKYEKESFVFINSQEKTKERLGLFLGTIYQFQNNAIVEISWYNADKEKKESLDLTAEDEQTTKVRNKLYEIMYASLGFEAGDVKEIKTVDPQSKLPIVGFGGFLKDMPNVYAEFTLTKVADQDDPSLFGTTAVLFMIDKKFMKQEQALQVQSMEIPSLK